MRSPENETCSIGLASALFNLSDAEFVHQYIRSYKLRVNKLHQLNWHQVLMLYWPKAEREKWQAINDRNAEQL